MSLFSACKYKLSDYPPLVHFRDVYHLRNQKGRDERFQMLLDGNEQLMTYYPDNSVLFLIRNLLSFDYISRHLAIRRMLLDPNSSSTLRLCWVIDITFILAFNPLILRFIFESTDIDIWRALLSAQIAILPAALSEDDTVRVDWKCPLLKCILHSMVYWNAEQLLFAHQRGLFTAVQILSMTNFCFGRHATIPKDLQKCM